MKVTSEIKNALEAGSAGDLNAVQRLIRKNPDLKNDSRVLNAAALHGHASIVKFLLESGADPNQEVLSHEHYRPLHRVIEHRGVPKNPGHLETTRLLLEKGSGLDTRGTWMSITPLAVAGMKGDREFIKLVLAKDPGLDIYSAAILADAKGVGRFLEKTPSLAKTKDVNQMTPLHYAALSGLKEAEDQENLRKLTLLLLENGGDPNARENIGPYPKTPVLHFTAWGNNFAVAKTLLAKGANPNFGFGNCLWHEPLDMADLFLSHGADVNSEESPGVPLLHSRIHWNLPGICLWLIRNGANPNAVDGKGNTALHVAARKGINARVIEALVERGGNLKAKDGSGKTPLEIARKMKKTKTSELLQSLERNSNIAGKRRPI